MFEPNIFSRLRSSVLHSQQISQLGNGLASRSPPAWSKRFSNSCCNTLLVSYSRRASTAIVQEKFGLQYLVGWCFHCCCNSQSRLIVEEQGQTVTMYKLFAWATAARLFWEISADIQARRSLVYVHSGRLSINPKPANLSRAPWFCRKYITAASPSSNSRFSPSTAASFQPTHFASLLTLWSVPQ